jgi:release factor glutamine methyltransferase
MTGYTLSELVRSGTERLAQCGVENAAYDSFELMSAVNGMDRTYYLMHGNEPVADKDCDKFEMYIKRRCSREPLQHILGKAWFYGYEFIVNENVLVPRSDTEILVENVLSVSDNTSRILDMCTGSGCIILTLAKQGHLLSGLGVDYSEKALSVAKKNRELLQVENVEFVQSDLFKEKKLMQEYIGHTDIIVSNPPYIPTKVIEGLADEVRCFDPMMALDGHEDGLYFYRKITSQAKEFLKPGGFLFYEIGHDQSEAVENELALAGYTEIVTIKDLSGLDRVVKGRLR